MSRPDREVIPRGAEAPGGGACISDAPDQRVLGASGSLGPGQALASARLESLDAFRGFVILGMLLVNNLAGMKGIPPILLHAPAGLDTFTFADLVFPGFLFIMGVSLPLAMQKRMTRGASPFSTGKHILIRAFSLLFLGVLMVSKEQFSPAHTALGKDAWYFLAFLAVFSLWNHYPETVARTRSVRALRGAALLLLAGGLALYRGAGESGEAIWLRHSWWGILGEIGWAYLTCSLCYCLCRGNVAHLVGVFAFMIALYIGERSGALSFLAPVSHFVSIGSMLGSRSSITMAGVLVGSSLLSSAGEGAQRGRILSWAVSGAGLVAAACLLRPLYPFSKMQGTASFCLVSAGINVLAFTIFYVVIDVMKLRAWSRWLVPIGTNALFAYLAQGLVEHALNLAHLKRFLWFWWSLGGWQGLLNAVLATSLLYALTWAATRHKVVLKL